MTKSTQTGRMKKRLTDKLLHLTDIKNLIPAKIKLDEYGG